MRKIISIFYIFFCLLNLYSAPNKVLKGTIFFDNPQILKTRVVSLDGQWEFYHNKLIHSAYEFSEDANIFKRIDPDFFIPVPSFWEDSLPIDENGKKNSFGIGSYRLLIAGLKPNFNYALMMRESPSTSSRWFINEKEAFRTGILNEDYTKAKPQAVPCFVEFTSNENGVAELIIQVANGIHRKGGLWDSVLLAEESCLYKFFVTQSGISFSIFGVIIFLAFFNIILYFLSPKNKYSLWLFLFSLAIASRIPIAGFSILTLTFPNFPYGLQLKLEYMALWLAPSTFFFMLESDFKEFIVAKKLGNILVAIQFALGFISFVLPIRYANHLVSALQISAVVTISYIIYVVFVLISQRYTVAIPYAIILILLGIGVGINILFTSVKGIFPFDTLPFFLLFFCVYQFLLISRKQNKLYKKAIMLNNNLQKLNKSYTRFVPKEFLQLLNKKSVVDVNIGDHIETEMAITYTNLQIIPTNTEEKLYLSPEHNYAIFSEFFKNIAPLTKKHKGFISKFVSTGFIALFPKSVDDAVNFATEIKKNVANYNKNKANKLKVFVSTGVHFGKMILGTIGEPNRLDDTVISDTVNTVSRIELTARKLQESVVLSETACKQLSNETINKYHLKPLGNITVKGKKIPLILKSAISLLLCFCLFLPLKAQSFEITNYEDLQNNGAEITGPWEFYFGKFIDPKNPPKEEPDCLIEARTLWNNFDIAPEYKQILKTGLGSGSYRILIKNLKPSYEYGLFLFDIAGTAFNLYANGQKICSIGEPNVDWTKSVPNRKMEQVFFSSTPEGTIELVLHVSNNFHRIGGIWKPIILKEKVLLKKDFLKELYKNFLFLGALLIIILYQFSLWFFRRDNKSSLYLSLFTLSILLRLLSSGFSLLSYYIPSISLELLMDFEYLSLYLGPLFFTLYITQLYPDLFSGKFLIIPRIIIILGCINAVIPLFVPFRIKTFLVRPWQIYLLFTAFSIIIKLIYKIFTQKTIDTILMGLGLFTFLLCNIHDILYLSTIPVPIHTDLVPYAFIIFVIIQFIITANQHNEQQIKIDKFTDDLQKTINACYRFVPQEFLEFFNKEDITSVKLGEQTTKSLTLMNTDIRNFTTISEQISAKETFDLLNIYLMRIAPIIRSHNGFIEKYLGDGIIALFPENNDKAALCALKIHKEMIRLRSELEKQGKPTLKIGIGLHYGTVVLGTVGDDERMNEIIVSPDIDTVITMESLTKTFDKPIIVSESAKNAWKNESMCYNFIELDCSKISNEYKLEENCYAIEEV